MINNIYIMSFNSESVRNKLLKNDKNKKIKHKSKVSESEENDSTNDTFLSSENNKGGKISSEEKRSEFFPHYIIKASTTFIILKLSFIFKAIYLEKKVKDYKILSSTKIASNFRGFLSRKKFYTEYIINRIMDARIKSIEKIKDSIRNYLYKKKIEEIIQKHKDNYIIYSSINCKPDLYFKIENNIDEDEIKKLNFIYCEPIKSFVLFIDKEKKNFYSKPLIGKFYNNNNTMFLDNLFPIIISKEGKLNVIDIAELLEQRNKIDEKYKETIEKWKNKKNNRSKSEKKPIKNSGLKKCKSSMRLKNSILKPCKSHINLRALDKKVNFGKTQYQNYDLQ